MEKRPVTVFEYFRPEVPPYNKPYQKRIVGKGVFHSFGCGYEEFETGPGNYSTAIVELEDGNVVTPDPTLIRFDD